MIEIAGRKYAEPRRKTVVFCIDGCEPEYLDAALADGLCPNLEEALARGGLYVRGRGQIPSFTNPNNLSIVTGQPPAVHGISGNYYFDEARGVEVPMTDPSYLRVPTILARMEQAGVRTLCITAKDKLRALLGAADRGAAPLSLSAEMAHEQRLPGAGGGSVTQAVGKANPSIYDPAASHYAMEMGLALHERVGARLLYVSLTDYVQHKHAPRSAEANRFYARFDELFGEYVRAGFVCAVTADHGMNDKTRSDGSPNVRYLDDVLRAAGVEAFRVVLPITDPYVVHHGALGSYATVHVGRTARERARAALAAVEGIELVLSREDAADRFRLPADRIGDLVLLADKSTVLGKSEAAHDLSGVRSGLRSHGGLHEATVPIIVCAPLGAEARERAAATPGGPSNADVFDLVLSGPST